MRWLSPLICGILDPALKGSAPLPPLKPEVGPSPEVMMKNGLLAICVAALALHGCRTQRPPEVAPSPPPAAPAASTGMTPGAAYDSLAPLGSRSNPVRSGGPFGEREYLRRLRCADGAAPSFNRNGSVGGGADSHILDVYAVTCPGAASTASVFMDMYHGDVRERRPVPGFTVLAELPARTAPGCPPQVGPTADSSARYVFNYLEVETPTRPLNLPSGPVSVGFEGYASVGFVVDTLGRVEPGSLQIGDFVQPRVRTSAEQVVLGLRFAPAEHRPGCRVRQGTGVSLQFR